MLFKLALLLGLVALVAAQSCTTSASCDNVGFCQAAEDTGCGYCDCVSGTCTVKEVPGFPTRGEECFTFSSSDIGRCYEGRCRFDYCQTQECYFGVRQTDGTCDPNQLTVIAGASCNDGFGCTTNDKCTSAGICAGTPQSSLCAPDPNPCLETSCSPTQGCVTTGLAGPCEGCALPAGGNPECYDCVCLDGECIANPKIGPCDNGNECSAGVCAANNLNVYVCTNGAPRTGEDCDDGNACTTGDKCTAQGTCAGTLSCDEDPDLFCTTGIVTGCTPDGQCIYQTKNDGGRCIDCPVASGSDSSCYDCVCSDGVCNTIGRVGRSCPLNDLTSCYDGICALSGSAFVCTLDQTAPKDQGAQCDDLKSCTSNDVCDGNGACVGSPNDQFCENLLSGDCTESAVCDPTGNGDENGCLVTFKSSAVLCAPSNGCDTIEFCTGSSPNCPLQVPLPAGTVCLEGTGCIADNVCDGTTDTCPFGSVPQPAGTLCLESRGPCQADSFCDGSSFSCPTVFLTGECRAASGLCDEPEFCTGTSLLCPPDAFVAAGTPCGVDDGNSCTVQACSGNSSECITTVLPDDTACTNECGVGSCQSGICLCPCELECVLTRGAAARNSPGAKGKDRNDPVWQTDLFQNTEVCGRSLDDWFNKKKSLPSGCENNLLAQYFTVLYNIERYRLSTGVACDGLFGEDEVQAVMDEVENWIPTLNAFTCETTSVPQCANKVTILSNFSEGLNSVEHCSSSLPIEIAAIADSSAQAAHNHTHISGSSDDDSDLGAGGIIAIVFASIVGLILLALAALLCLGVWGNAFAKDSSSKKSRRYKRAANDY